MFNIILHYKVGSCLDMLNVYIYITAFFISKALSTLKMADKISLGGSRPNLKAKTEIYNWGHWLLATV